MKEYTEIVGRKCPICGKFFIPASYHIYKAKGRMVCSYLCQLAGEEKEEKKELEPCVIIEDRITRQSKRYGIYARRTETDEWTAWSEVNDIDSALAQRNFGESYGFLMKITDLPIEVYLNQGARDAFETLKSYIAEQKLRITNENLENILLLVLQELTEKKE